MTDKGNHKNFYFGVKWILYSYLKYMTNLNSMYKELSEY